jgi:hypothetical protein
MRVCQVRRNTIESGSRPTELEKAADLVSDLNRFFLEAQPGEMEDPVAGDLKLRVTRPIALECRPMTVELEAIQFDDQPLAGPKGIDLSIQHRAVEGWGGKSPLLAEDREAILERRSRPHRLPGSRDKAAESSCAFSTLSACAGLLHRSQLQ